MIYHLFQLFESLGWHVPGGGLMNYISFRAIMAALTALAVALVAGKKIIRWLQKRQIGETIRDLGLEGQMQKKGTPTMGGIIILLAILCGALLFCRLDNIYTILLIITAVWLGTLGFADDYIKVFKHDKEGLRPKAKLALQFLLALGIGLAMCFTPDFWPEDTKEIVTTIPFVKEHEFNYAWLVPFKGQFGMYCTWVLYVLVIIFIILACSNGTNLTDGLDGLAAGTSAIVGVVIGIFGWLSSSLVNSHYLNILYLPGSGEVAVFMAAFTGALLGFLWYNCYPAQVFMGDTGSLALGGIIGVSAMLTRKELLLPVLCGIFLVESLSVLLQKGYFKYTKKKYGAGRRIFRMAPLHHHYQKEGIPALIQKPAKSMPESRITARFWIVGILLAVATLAMLKTR